MLQTNGCARLAPKNMLNEKKDKLKVKDLSLFLILDFYFTFPFQGCHFQRTEDVNFSDL